MNPELTSAVMPLSSLNSKYRVLLHGLPYFCKMLPRILNDPEWDIHFHPTNKVLSMMKLVSELRRTDLLFVWGARISMGKVLRAAKALQTKRIVLFWCGSDTLAAQKEFAAGKLDPWIATQIHWAGAPWLAQEIRDLGIACEYVPITWVKPVKNPPGMPEHFSVLTYLPTPERGHIYGLDRILKVSRSLPHIPFTLVGLLSGKIDNPPPNLRILGREPNIDTFFRNATVYWRPVSHDGLAFMALEALSHGRHVMWSYPFPHCVQTRTAEEDCLQIERLHALHKSGKLDINQAGVEFIRHNFTPERVRESYLQRWRGLIAPQPWQSRRWKQGEFVGGSTR